MQPQYSTPQFEEKYTYTGTDLGAVYTPAATAFRVWAPTASAVNLNLYAQGQGGRARVLSMDSGPQGTWALTLTGDLAGTYYTYTATVDGTPREACDPYAQAVGVNGRRALVLPMASTDPAGWDRDKNPQAGKPITDCIIYELHLRDLSLGPGAGIAHKGKYLGLTETGTRTPGGQKTGLDHMADLGITHVHLLPVYDYGSVDEADPRPQFNWGYDPVNFNAPEGSYATDPFDGAVRIREFKQMVAALHSRGIAVILDVVYNHVFKKELFCMNRLVPGYFSRGSSNGSGCGNDTASERSMVRKYIVDSLCHWAREYHIDGFRFDLVGLLDTDTVNAAMAAVHRFRPDVIFYGEGWDIPTQVTKPGLSMAIQRNSHLTPGFAYFSDTVRDTLRGGVWESADPGFISGKPGLEAQVQKCFLGLPDWCQNPCQSINYGSCHDNLTLFDKITLSAPRDSRQTHIRMNNLAAAVYMLSQGVPFFQAGEELLRTKGGEHNSYKSPDSINAIRWDSLDSIVTRQVRDYYRGLIAFRKAHPVLRLQSAQAVRAAVHSLPGLGKQAVGFRLTGAGEELLAVFNAGRSPLTLSLPQGRWEAHVHNDRAGAAPLFIYTRSLTVPPLSATVLVKN